MQAPSCKDPVWKARLGCDWASQVIMNRIMLAVINWCRHDEVDIVPVQMKQHQFREMFFGSIALDILC